MKILHILDHSLPLHSGYTFRSQNIFCEQKKRGWEPVIITSPKHEQNWKGHWSSKDEINGFSYYRTGSVPESSEKAGGEFKLVRALARRVEEVATVEKPDVLHAHSPVLNAIPTLWVGRKLKMPVVYEIRAFWEDAGVDHGTYTQGSMKYRLVRSFETWLCRHADQVVVLCKGLKEDLIKRGINPNKIATVYNGINGADFSFRKPDENFAKVWRLDGKKVIGFIGSFYRYEGLDLLIQAFAHLTAKRPDVVLLLVGGGKFESELKNQIQRLGLDLQIGGSSSSPNQPAAGNRKPETSVSQPATRNPQLATPRPRVVMPGRIPHEHIPGIYALANVLAYPRYSMPLTELVTPLKPLEAMAMGKALVASDVGGHKELIRDGETGLLFPSGSVSALTESLERLLDDSSLRERLQDQGATWVREHHTWEKTTAVYEEIYSRALGR